MNATPGNFRQSELDKFDELAQRWWDPQGPQKALHALNPPRLGYIAARVPLRDAAVLDVGCGAGLLSEALAQAGAKVVAIDLAPNLLKVARLHGLESGIKVDYRESPVEALAAEMPAADDEVAETRGEGISVNNGWGPKRIVTENGVAPARIVFEITERDTVKNLAVLEQFLIDLKADGFKLAIDDFGSGFSSFHYLRRFPIDYLKIEGDFIANMLSSDKDRTFVTSIRSLAREMGIAVVAEYVESAEVLAELEKMDTHLAQGYYIGRPAAQILPEAWSAPEGN